MFTQTREVLTFTIAATLFTQGVGCADIPEYSGPLCDQAETADWSQASSWPELDGIEYAAWTDDPELEQSLRSYGMDDEWDFLSGNDVDLDGIVVSPYGKTLNAIELIVTTPGLEGWSDTLLQGYPLHGSCGEKTAYTIATTWKSRGGHRTDVYRGFYDRSVVSRASFLIHEAAHAAGGPGHVDDMDRNWEEHGSYRLQVEFLAAVYYAEGASEGHREAALEEFEWIIRDKFLEPTDLTIEDLRPTKG